MTILSGIQGVYRVYVIQLNVQVPGFRVDSQAFVGHGIAWFRTQHNRRDHAFLREIQGHITRIPWEGAQNDTILHYLDALRRLIESPMMDLSEYTNTDLKLAYGIGNFQTLSTYDETYQNFLQTLTALGRAYMEAGDYTHAAEACRLCLDYDPKNRIACLSLAEVYKKDHKNYLLSDLIDEIKHSPIARKESLLREINEL